MTTFSIVVVSTGRQSLRWTLESLSMQLLPGDQLLVDVNDDCPWGNHARQRTMQLARGDALLFMDDDDVYVPGALNVIRAALDRAPDRVHMFRMRYPSGFALWGDQEVRLGNVSTQMVCVPNRADSPGLGRWGDRREGDYDFIKSTCELQGEPLWHEDVIALLGHDDE